MLGKIGVLTSGGDAPGMNAAVRAVVRKAISHGIEVMGIYGGYRGLLEGDVKNLTSRSVGNIIQRGGTILRTARSMEYKKKEGVERAKEALEKNRIQGLVTIGGDGTLRGAVDMLKIWDGKIVGVPGTIDNDLYGTDETIGFDTAINTAVRAIDNIRDTADAHERFFIVEVMGRHAGFIALDVGMGGGAEEVLMPESKTDLERICKNLEVAKQKGKTSSVIVVAEGEEEGGANQIAEKLKSLSGCDYHVVVLGHIQRGGSPTARDRKLATRLGAYAVDCLLEGKSGVMAGETKGELTTVPLKDAIFEKKPIDGYSKNLIPILAHQLDPRV